MEQVIKNKDRLTNGIVNKHVQQHGTNNYMTSQARPQVMNPEYDPVKYESLSYKRISPRVNRINVIDGITRPSILPGGFAGFNTIN